MIRLFLFMTINFILGAESGASFSWSAKWQNKTFLGHKLQQVPEILDAIMLAHLAVSGWSHFMDMEAIKSIGLSYYHVGMSVGSLMYAMFVAVIYAGIQSATWLFLQWEGHKDPKTKRKSTLKPVVDFIAGKMGFSLGDEGYSWVAATVKGTIITLPMGGLGGIFFALGYEIGSHAKGRVDKYLNPHIISEGLSFMGVGIYAIMFLEFCKLVGQ